MSLGTMPEDATTRVVALPPKEIDQSTRSTRKVIIIGAIISGILAYGGYTVHSKQGSKGIPEGDKIVENIGKILGIEYIHISK